MTFGCLPSPLTSTTPQNVLYTMPEQQEGQQQQQQRFDYGSEVFLPREFQDFLYGNHSFNGDKLLLSSSKPPPPPLQQQTFVKFAEPEREFKQSSPIHKINTDTCIIRSSSTLTATTISTACTEGSADDSLVSTGDNTVTSSSKGSILKVKSQDESLRARNKSKRSKGGRCGHHHVEFDQVKVHYHSLALAGPELISVSLRFPLSPPYMAMGDWLESQEWSSVGDYEVDLVQERGGTRYWGGTHRHESMGKKQQQHMNPLRIYARERLLQKSGVSVVQIHASKVALDHARAQLKPDRSEKLFRRLPHAFHGSEYKPVPKTTTTTIPKPTSFRKSSMKQVMSEQLPLPNIQEEKKKRWRMGSRRSLKQQ